MQIADINFTFIILNVDRNVVGLKATVNSIKADYNQGFLCIVDKGIKEETLKEISDICPVHKAKEAIDHKMEELDIVPALINTGIKASPTDWNFIIISGTRVRPNLKRKFDIFVRSEKDILYPIFNRNFNFKSASINGLLLNKKAIEEIGEWPTKMWKENTSMLQLSKDFWYDEACNKDYNFKGIVGMRIC